MLYDFIAGQVLWSARFSHFEQNEPKWLSMNYLRAKPGFSIQAHSSLIKPNQVIFLNRDARQSPKPILHQSGLVCVFRGPMRLAAPGHFAAIQHSLNEG